MGKKIKKSRIIIIIIIYSLRQMAAQVHIRYNKKKHSYNTNLKTLSNTIQTQYTMEGTYILYTR